VNEVEPFLEQDFKKKDPKGHMMIVTHVLIVSTS
jgi:hypothetical protein